MMPVSACRGATRRDGDHGLPASRYGDDPPALPTTPGRNDRQAARPSFSNAAPISPLVSLCCSKRRSGRRKVAWRARALLIFTAADVVSVRMSVHTFFYPSVALERD